MGKLVPFDKYIPISVIPEDVLGSCCLDHICEKKDDED